MPSPAGWAGRKSSLIRFFTDDDVIAKIDAVTAKQIQEVARKLLVSDKLRLAVVGQVKQDGDLEKLLKI